MDLGLSKLVNLTGRKTRVTIWVMGLINLVTKTP